MGRDYVESSTPDDDEGRDGKKFSEMTPPEIKSDRRVRLWVGGILAVLGLVFIAQNTDQVRIRVLVWNFDIPLIFVLVGMIALGVVITLLVQWRDRRKAARSKSS